MSRSIRHGSSWPTAVGVSRSLYDLRYSAAELMLADAEGRRPHPHRLRARTDNPCAHGRCFDFAMMNSAYGTAQRSVRTAERAVLGELRKAVAGGVEADDVAFGERADGRRAAW